MGKYLELRGRVYWFKRRAPVPLKAKDLLLLDGVSTAVGKNGYVRFSLETASPKEAAALARKYAHLLDEEAKKRPRLLGQRAPLSKHPHSSEAIQAAADAMYATLLAADECTYETEAQKLFDGEEEVRDPDRFQFSTADLPPESLQGQARLLKQIAPLINFYLMQTTERGITDVSASLMPFADAFRRFVGAMELRKKSVHVPTPVLTSKPTPTEFSVTVLYDKFKAYQIAAKRWKNPELQDSREYGPIVREFIAVVGDKDVYQLNRQDAEKYFEHTMGRNDISLGTKKRNFSRIKAMLSYGRKKLSVPDITGPLEIETSYKKTHASYERFTPDELKALFHSEAYSTSRFAKASHYWLPMLGLYTGGRLDELASLRVEDITEIKGVWCAFLSGDEANDGGKNQYAPRWVPMHKELLTAGFLAHVQTLRSEGHTRLFPELGDASRDGPGKRATVDFTDYRRSVNVGAQEGRSTKVFHSFRSTLISELIYRKTDDYMRHLLLGHATKNDDKFKDVHFTVYDQSDFDVDLAKKVIAKANFGLKHPKFVDTPEMVAARKRYSKKGKA